MYIVYFYIDDNIALFCDDDIFGYNFDTWDSNGFKHSDLVKELKDKLIYFKSIEHAMETLNRVKDLNVLVDFLGDHRTIEEVHEEYGLSIGLYEEVLPYNYDKLKLGHLNDRLNSCRHMKEEFDHINDKDMGTRIILGKIFTIVMELDPYYKNIRNQLPILNKKIELIYEDYIGMKNEKISVYQLIHNIWYYDIGLDYPYNYKFLSANEVKLSDNDIVDRLLEQIDLVISKLKKRSFKYSQIKETERHIIMNLGNIR
jgi:hypothetical protein